MPRFIPERRDKNEPKIIKAIKGLGVPVYRIKGVFKDDSGTPDLLIPWRGWTVLAEVKDPERDHARSRECIRLDRLDPDQCNWHALWSGGPLFVWTTPEQAVDDLLALNVRG